MKDFTTNSQIVEEVNRCMGQAFNSSGLTRAMWLGRAIQILVEQMNRAIDFQSSMNEDE